MRAITAIRIYIVGIIICIDGHSSMAYFQCSSVTKICPVNDFTIGKVDCVVVIPRVFCYIRSNFPFSNVSHLFFLPCVSNDLPVSPMYF